MYSPTQYLKDRKESLGSMVSQGTANYILAADKPGTVSLIVGDVPAHFADKYHAYMRRILIMAYIDAVFKNTTRNVTMSQKHDFMMRALYASKSYKER